MAEEHKEQEVGEQEQAQYPESRQADTWNKDVVETGRWGSLRRKELWIFVGAVFLIVGVTVIGVSVSAVNNKSTELVGKTKLDAATGMEVSAYELPTPPAAVHISDQEELDALRKQLTDSPTMSPYASAIPATTAALGGVADTAGADPYARAAAWLVTVDTFNVEADAATRFALASLYYSTGGPNWTTSTNWMSNVTHCDWYGVGCCIDEPQNVKCNKAKPYDFYSVMEVDLYNNTLAGPIPESVSLLTGLQTLFLSNNALTGSIPGPAFGKLPDFSKLYLAYNKLSGTIPADFDNNQIFGTCPLHVVRSAARSRLLCSLFFRDLTSIRLLLRASQTRYICKATT